MSDPTWFRVEFDSDGNIVEVTACAAPSLSEGQVFYVAANSEAEAWRVARNAYERARVKRQRAAYQAAGKCRCGRSREDSAFKQCLTCRTRNLNHLQGLRANGPRDEAARVAAMQGRQRDRRQELRLETLLLVRAQWREAPNQHSFTVWLAEQVMSAIAKVPVGEMTQEQLEEAVLDVATAIQSARVERGHKPPRIMA